MQESENQKRYHPDDIHPVRTYRDRVFRMLFKEKCRLLELYNAMNDSDYTDPEALTVTTLENAVYMGMKNDISFVMDAQLNLYEHQSTKNENMPLRCLFYVTDLYSSIVSEDSLFRQRLIRLPAPRFIVFYNGKVNMPERMEMKLSHAFEKEQREPWLELKVQVLNINLGHNKELAEKSRTLYEYMMFTAKVCEYSRLMRFPEAIRQAVDDCIQDGILEDFLQKNRAEVMKMCIYEYDEEKHMQLLREDCIAEGLEQGIEQGIERGMKQGIEQGMKQGIEQGMKQGIKQGMEQGIEQGIKQGHMEERECMLERIVLHMLDRGRTPEYIAEELGEDVSVVKQICKKAEGRQIDKLSGD